MAEMKLKPDAMKVQDEALMNAGYSRKWEGSGCWSYHKEGKPIYKRKFILREKVWLFEYPNPIKAS